MDTKGTSRLQVVGGGFWVVRRGASRKNRENCVQFLLLEDDLKTTLDLMLEVLEHPRAHIDHGENQLLRDDGTFLAAFDGHNLSIDRALETYGK